MRHPEEQMLEIRRLDPSGWSVYRELRLAALADAPGAFGATLAEAARWTPAQWEQRVRDRACFVAFDGGRPVGLASGTRGEGPGAAELNSMWVAPAYRRRSLGEGLVREVVGWAREQGYRELRLTVVDDNRAARLFYEGLGFHPTGATVPYPNDARRWEVELVLPLEP